MDDAFLMRAIERVRGLRDDADDESGGETLFAREPRPEVFAFEQLHHDVWSERLGGAGVEHLHDVRALHVGAGDRLLGEARAELRAREDALGHELHGDLLLEAAMESDPHRAHAAGADPANELDARRHEGSRPRHRAHTGTLADAAVSMLESPRTKK